MSSRIGPAGAAFSESRGGSSQAPLDAWAELNFVW